MVNKYYILRHGDTVETKNNIGYGSNIFSEHILPDSIPVIKKLANYLKDIPSDINLTSEFARCVETANIIFEITGKQFRTDVRLNEYYEESFDHLKQRVNNFLSEINTKDIDTAIICTHGGIISALTHLITNNSFDENELLDYPRPGILVIIENKQITKINFN